MFWRLGNMIETDSYFTSRLSLWHVLADQLSFPGSVLFLPLLIHQFLFSYIIAIENHNKLLEVNVSELPLLFRKIESTN